MGKRGHDPAEAPMGKTKHSNTQALTADPDTPAAEHTFIGVISKYRATVINRKLMQNLTKALRIEFHPQVVSYFLKLTGTATEAMGTVHRVTG